MFPLPGKVFQGIFFNYWLKLMFWNVYYTKAEWLVGLHLAGSERERTTLFDHTPSFYFTIILP